VNNKAEDIILSRLWVHCRCSLDCHVL